MKLIYLHGFASGPMSGKAQFFRRRLAESGLELRIPDLSEGNFEGLTLSSQLQVVERAAGAGEDIRLMGSSMGGYLAALYAARHPEVSRLVLMAPAFGFARRWPLSLGAEKTAEWRRTGFLPVYHYAEKKDSRVGYALLEDGQQYEDYPEVRQPALIFHGRQDDVVPCRYSEEFATLHSGVTLRIMESGHELINVLEEMWLEARPFLVGP
ncbi:MAG TPA: YqiA/YcfP family alpha/beta fold hydrolase [Bryobacteraceae bacterium]|jgi:pimeloyl-ACP methyl ester carboxylesterase|nr:YqiA/YcfP family alpha/beta fold hydrolase [Bryobacteraceae bacterium]